MTDNYVLILQRTPFPAHWYPMPIHQLEQAEKSLSLSKYVYHECGYIIGNSQNQFVLYPEPIAQKIVSYWKWRMPHVEFTLLTDI